MLHDGGGQPGQGGVLCRRHGSSAAFLSCGHPAAGAGAEIPILLPRWQQRFLDREHLFFPQGILFAHDVTWAVTRGFFSVAGQAGVTKSKRGGRWAEGGRGVAVRRERGGFGIGMN